MLSSNQSSSLIHRIQQRLSQFPDYRMPFSMYMSSCMYDQEEGYYTKSSEKVGPAGDFYTSVYIGDAMALIIERYIQLRCSRREWKDKTYRIVEWGAGTGKLAEQLLSVLQHSDCRPLEYVVIESSPYHRRMIKERLVNNACPIPVICWDEQNYFEQAAEMPIFLVANELLDAFPVERIRRQNSKLDQAYVIWNGDKSMFEYEWAEAEDHVIDWAKQHDIGLQEGQIYDAGIAASEWLGRVLLAAVDIEGVFIDYGDGTRQLTGAHRMNGSLLCYRKHQAYDDPFAAPGDQDMTADVDFDIAERIAFLSGCKVLPRMDQKQFLVENGVLDLLQEHSDADPFSEKAKSNRKIRQLLLSDQMSERFKVMTISKGLE
ncbi:SAM-dependent methyltransferase [Paenibacillus arenosi]|uniref:SAM-dependent methyltransferase n=1 Tax=Paenibacillus arenosi TaxID=2774142 RepID=A0ABR9ASS0_9BACL|nr:SAM-dependent methyltransferase [Paenibacillus arenosi]MBD8496748.1 SAM-dependent methyltransferase [Paenibacillus arenosi]